MFKNVLPEVFRVQLIIFIEIVNTLAKRASSREQSRRLYAFKDILLMQAIESLAEDSLDFTYELRPDGVYVAVTIRAVRYATTHLPYTKLTPSAEKVVCYHAGTPQEFLRERNRRLLSPSAR